MPFAIVDSKGDAISYCTNSTDMANPLPDGLSVVEIAEFPEYRITRWDSSTKSVVALSQTEIDALPK